MKTKKLLIMAMFLLAGTAMQAQENKPTKEATIEWLKPKLLEWTSFGKCSDLVFEVNSCEIILTGKEDGEPFRSVWNTNFKEMTHEGAESSYWVEYDYEGGYSAVTKDSPASKPYTSTSHHLLTKKTPPEMAKRIENAIRHLATFCAKYNKSEDEPF